MDISNHKYMGDLRKSNVDDFELLYKNYYVYLCFVAEQVVKNPVDAEEIVSEVFLKLWNNKESLVITSSLKTYLIRAVHNTALNYLEKMRPTNYGELPDFMLELAGWDNDYPLGRLFEKEAFELLEKGIHSLPEGCREIFLLSRDKDMTYNDIAQRLGISVNTVKTQMKIALSRIRELLKDYMPILLVFLNI